MSEPTTTMPCIYCQQDVTIDGPVGNYVQGAVHVACYHEQQRLEDEPDASWLYNEVHGRGRVVIGRGAAA